MQDNNELKGLGGWLILVGIGVVISPFRILLTLVQTFKPILEDGTWEAITTIGSDAYHPLWETVIIGEMTFNIVMVILWAYLVYLFLVNTIFFRDFISVS